MSARKDKTEKRTAWLMELGRELRAEYEDFVRTNPLPPRLVALADQVEHAVQTSRRQRSASFRTEKQTGSESLPARSGRFCRPALGKLP
jgi:hypothetical protein